ncbi:hypothetical protein AAFF_G00093290 [Aldrovandia affinis]|uniref:Uncharacterized protein n=1 Tax=Aldrovandia affinis TaxID=143900 RepID=A0AAD7T2U3_9TELE|nr:hypothetical protein AAFF_G00093290 [Aldrovandia affinis]
MFEWGGRCATWHPPRGTLRLGPRLEASRHQRRLRAIGSHPSPAWAPSLAASPPLTLIAAWHLVGALAKRLTAVRHLLVSEANAARADGPRAASLPATIDQGHPS